jgi:hypothetical protein
MLVDNTPTPLHTQFSGKCNTGLVYSKVGDKTSLYMYYACMTVPPDTVYREMPLSKPPGSSLQDNLLTSDSLLILPSVETSAKMTVRPPTTPFSNSVVSSTSRPTSTPTANSDPEDGTKRIAAGLGLGLSLPFLPLTLFFCCSYRRISISAKIWGARATTSLVKYASGLEFGTRAEPRREEAGRGSNKAERGGKAARAVRYE